MSPGPLVGEGEGAEVGHLDQDNDDDHDGNRCGVVCLWKEQLDSAWWQLHAGDHHNHDNDHDDDNVDSDHDNDNHDCTELVQAKTTMFIMGIMMIIVKLVF